MMDLPKNSLQQTSPQEQKEINNQVSNGIKRPFVILLVVLVLILILIGYFFKSAFIKKQTPATQNQSQAQTETASSTKNQTYEPTASDVLQATLKKTKLDIPQISTTQAINSKSLPTAIQQLILDQQGLEASSVKYQDGRKGYEVKYLLPSDLYPSFQKLEELFKQKDFGWSVISWSRGSNAGIWEAENKDYYVRFTLTSGKPLETQATLLVISK